MNTTTLVTLSDHLADVVARVAPSIVQVQGRRQPASGIAFAHNAVLTTTRALGREDGHRVRTHDGRTVDAELAGWDPATGLAVLLADGLKLSPPLVSEKLPRVGHLALALARSWSNAITVTSGIVSVIGGPLQTGRGRTIDQVIRTDAPMHDGFAGGALLDVSGTLIGVATAVRIRALGVVIPASIAWKSASDVLEHGSPKMGFLGISGQTVRLNERQRGDAGRERALLIVAVSQNSPAEEAGLLVGDIMVRFDGRPIDSPEDLLGLLTGERVGRSVAVEVLRGGTARELAVTVGERSEGA